MKKVFSLFFLFLLALPNEAFSSTSFLRLSYCDYLASGSPSLFLGYVRKDNGDEIRSNAPCEPDETLCRPYYIADINGALFVIDTFGACSGKLLSGIDCNLISGSCAFTDNGNVENQENGGNDTAIDLSALLEILQGLPDQIMAVLLAYLTFKTFLDMVK